MSLTSRREKFAQCVADGKTQADAYRAAFDAGKMKDATIHKRASELMCNGEITGRVQELRDALANKALWTREDSVRALATAMRIAEDKDNAAGLVAAVKELNAMHGFNEPQKVEITTTPGYRFEVEVVKNNA